MKKILIVIAVVALVTCISKSTYNDPVPVHTDIHFETICKGAC